MANYEHALIDPSSEYASPQAVVDDESLSKEQKIAVLKQWQHDALEIMRADEENMAGESENMLSRVTQALREIQES